MILNTGNRTDIPGFYSEWFLNRLREGYVLARNPYYPEQITRYVIRPDVVDVLVFGTKNPAPMLPHLEELRDFRQVWHVTITPYGKDIEPGVPDKTEVLRSVLKLSQTVGPDRIFWRYDPIFLSERYTLEYHIEAFRRMCETLDGAVHSCVISFIDLYEKTKRNFPEARQVGSSDRLAIGEAFQKIASSHGIRIHACLEGQDLAPFGIDTSGCMTKQVLEHAIGEQLLVPSGTSASREGCACLLGSDIGAYNTCRHYCRYCYANYDRETVRRNSALHDPSSPLLIGHLRPGDKIRDARQKSWLTGQLTML